MIDNSNIRNNKNKSPTNSTTLSINTNNINSTNNASSTTNINSNSNTNNNTLLQHGDVLIKCFPIID